MATIGWLAILLAAWFARALAYGRAGNVVEDTRNALAALVTGDTKSLASTLSLRGTPDNVKVGSASGSLAPATAGATNSGAALLRECMRLGDGAQYFYGGSSNGRYDCSGLVYRAMVNLGMYKGPRFTTDTFGGIATVGGWARRTDTPAAGDVVVWPGVGVNGHMGVCTSPSEYYSALSVRAGIKVTPIASHRGSPVYWRMLDAQNGNTTGTYSRN